MAEFHVHQSPEAHYTVYQILFPDGRRYIGYTGCGLLRRRKKGYHAVWGVSAAIAATGWENLRMEPLCDKLTLEGAWALEARFIELFQTRDPRYGLNCRTGGPSNGSRCSEEELERRSRQRREYLAIPENYRRVFAHHTTRPVPVRCIETGESFPSISAAGRACGVYSFAIVSACSHPHRCCRGCHWEYVEKEKNAE